MKLVFLGAPGVGKGTLAQGVAKEFEIEHISTGAMLREKIKSGDELAEKLQSYMKSGQLVPEELINALLKEKLQDPALSKGYILDGYPRTLYQAEVLQDILQEMDTKLDRVVLVEIPEEIIIERLSHRLSCGNCGAVYNVVQNPPREENVCDICGGHLSVREDDKAETVKKRLKIYEEETKPLIDFYEEKGLLLHVDNSGAIEDAVESILETLRKGSN